MRFYEIMSDGLNEMAPQRVSPTQFNLGDDMENKKFAREKLKRVSEVIEENPDYRIVRTGDGNNGWIFLYNIKEETADYVVQYQTRNWSWMPKTITQCILWRNSLSTFAQGVTKRIFFDYLLEKFHAILGDEHQTENGRAFWLSRMASAVEMGLHVGIANTLTHTITWYDPTTDGRFRYWINKFDTFGDSKKYMTIRYLISK